MVNSAMVKKIKILVVDDSSIIRRAVTQALEEIPDIEVVAVAADGQEAIGKYIEFRPDVVTMDVIMPNMDGLSALKELVGKYKAPVIMLSGLTKEGANITVRALDLGAVDFITKPHKGSMLLNFQFLKEELITKIRAVAGINMDYYLALKSNQTGAKDVRSGGPYLKRSLAGYTKEELQKIVKGRVLVIGASTGGPKAVEYILARINKDFPGAIVVAQHMPRFFTNYFAEHLNKVSPFTVMEAQDGDILESGKVLVAPGDYDITIKNTFIVPQIELKPVEESQRKPTPSIDNLFYSAAAAYGKKTIGVILTGMGRDGSKGFKAIKIMGGTTIAQDEKSSLVFGMPKSAIADGVVDKIVSLHQIPETIEHMVTN